MDGIQKKMHFWFALSATLLSRLIKLMIFRAKMHQNRGGKMLRIHDNTVTHTASIQLHSALKWVTLLKWKKTCKVFLAECAIVLPERERVSTWYVWLTRGSRRRILGVLIRLLSWHSNDCCQWFLHRTIDIDDTLSVNLKASHLFLVASAMQQLQTLDAASQCKY